jgi:hypothetical protein
VKTAARKAGVSVSRWVAELIENRTRADWPAEARELAGGWPDFPHPTGNPAPDRTSTVCGYERKLAGLALFARASRGKAKGHGFNRARRTPQIFSLFRAESAPLDIGRFSSGAARGAYDHLHQAPVDHSQPAASPARRLRGAAPGTDAAGCSSPCRPSSGFDSGSGLGKRYKITPVAV